MNSGGGAKMPVMRSGRKSASEPGFAAVAEAYRLGHRDSEFELVGVVAGFGQEIGEVCVDRRVPRVARTGAVVPSAGDPVGSKVDPGPACLCRSRIAGTRCGRERAPTETPLRPEATFAVASSSYSRSPLCFTEYWISESRSCSVSDSRPETRGTAKTVWPSRPMTRRGDLARCNACGVGRHANRGDGFEDCPSA